MDKWIALGLIIGFLFGFSGISTLFNMLEKAVNEVQRSVTQASTLVLLALVIVLIWKVRVIASVLVGAIIGAVLNYILKANGIDVVNMFFEIFKIT